MGMGDSFLVCDEMVISAIAIRKFWSYRTDKKSPRAWKGVLLRVSVRGQSERAAKGHVRVGT